MNDHSVKILVLDDNEAGLYLKCRVIEHAGYQVFRARTGKEALAIIESEKPVIAILDVQLPDMNGLDICRQLKAGGTSVLILQTSATFIESRDRATGLDSGADAYLIEPMEPEELLATVNALLRVAKAEAQLRALNDTLEERIQARTHDLEQATEKLSQEIVDRQKAEAALRQVQKMEAIGQLTGGIAHDFNNLLTVIYGGLETIERRMKGDDPRMRLALQNTQVAAKRAAALTARLLAFARQQSLNPEVLDVNALVMETAELLRRTLGERIQLVVDLASISSTVEVDSNQLESSLLNLAVNARDAIADHGTLTIATGDFKLEDMSEDWHLGLPSGDYVTLSVTDDGNGMSEETMERAFDPFFTTKPLGQGTGLGLSQVYGFVKQSGGHVRIVSGVGKGTVVIIYLPRSNSLMSETDESIPPVATDTKATKTVLVVEDDSAVLQYSLEALQDMGYTVLNAGDGVSALNTLERHPEISVLFTDVGLPGGMNGTLLAAKAIERRPDLHVLYTTGYSQELDEGKETLPSKFGLIRKPFTYQQLAGKMHEIVK